MVLSRFFNDDFFLYIHNKLFIIYYLYLLFIFIIYIYYLYLLFMIIIYKFLVIRKIIIIIKKLKYILLLYQYQYTTSYLKL